MNPERYCGILGAVAATALQNLPGQEHWQPYLDAAPQNAASFASDPLGSLLALLPLHPIGFLAKIAHNYADILLFLLLLIFLSFLLGDARDADLLELVSSTACGVLLWGDLAALAGSLCEKMTEWKTFLLGFLPVYSGVLTAGGEVSAGSAACGSLLSGLCLLAQCVSLWTSPLLQSYLAVSMACCISSQKGLSDGCRLLGRLLKQGLGWAGRLFAALLGLQRVLTIQLDKTALQAGRFLAGSVPVIGDALSGAAEAVLTGMQLLKSSLGLAGLAILGAEFVPLYLTLLLHLLFLHGCRLLCDLAGNRRCQSLFACLAEAVQCMAAVTALFFGLTVVGVAALMITGGGG